MALVTKNDVTQIFAIQAPEVDLPPTFANYPRGWDTARSNNGKPTIKQFNYIQQRTDQNVLWIHQNGAALPYDATMEYAENAHVVKDGELQKKQGAGWVSAANKGYNLDYFVSGKSYPLHAEIMLENGDIVKSAVANNIINPNVDMTGWFPVNIETVTPGQFKTYSGDDWTQAIINMFKYCNDMPTGYGITAAQINNALHSNSYKRVRLTKLYRTTKPIHIPPNIEIEQPFTGFFSKNSGTVGIYYDPIDAELDTYAVSPFLYKKDIDGTYHLDESPYTLPTGVEFDNGSYIMTGQRILLNNLSVCTKPNVTLGFRFVGFAGSVANNINVGTNDGTSSRIPKVAILTNGCWNAVFNKPCTLSSNQGWVNSGSNGGMTVNNPYINKGYNATPIADIVPIFNPVGHTENGAIAIVSSSDCFWNQPITEHWYFNYVATQYMRVLHPHVEGSSTRNIFYFIGTSASADIELKPILTVDSANPLSSIVYVKNCDIQNSIVLKGRNLGSATIVRGTGSTACVSVKFSRNHFFIQAGKWGDLSLIRSIDNFWGGQTIYVNPLTGNDEAVGLRDLNPLKTLDNVKRLCELMGIDTVNIISNLVYTVTVNLPQKITFTGQEIRGAGSALLCANGKDLNIRFNNSSLAHDSQGVLYLNGLSLGKVTFNCALEGTTGFIQAQNTADIDVVIKNTSMSLRNIVYGNTSYKQTVGLNIDTTATLAINLLGGNATSKYCNLDLVSVTYDPPSIAAGSTTTTTVTLPATPIGTPVSAAFDKYNADIEISAVVSAANSVTVKFKNNGVAAVDLASGVLTVKKI